MGYDLQWAKDGSTRGSHRLGLQTMAIIREIAGAERSDTSGR